MITDFYLYIPGLRDYAGTVYLELNKETCPLEQRNDLQEDIFQVRLDVQPGRIEYYYAIGKEKEKCNKISRYIQYTSNQWNSEVASTSIQFFDTPEYFEEIRYVLKNKITLKQNDIQNSLLMFAQTNSNPEMLKGLIEFIKTNCFRNERELLKKLEEKVFRHAQELLNLEKFGDILDKFDIFKDIWFQSQLIESSKILQIIQFKATDEILMRVNQEIVELKRRFNLEQLMREIFKQKPIFPVEDLASEVIQRIKAVQYPHQLTQIQEFLHNEQLKMNNEALVLFHEPLRLFWERSWQFQTKETPLKALQFLIHFKLQMKEIIQDNLNYLKDLFISCSNYSQSQFEEFYFFLLTNISEYLVSFDPTGEAITVLFKKPMTKIQIKQLFLEVLMNKVILKVNIQEFCLKIADSFKNVNEAIQYYETVKHCYGEVDLKESILLSFNSFINQLPSRQLFSAIDFIVPLRDLNRQQQANQDMNVENEEQKDLEIKMKQILSKKFSEISLSDLLVGINNKRNLQDCQDYFQIIILSLRSAAQYEEKNGKNIFDLLKQTYFKKTLAKATNSPLEVQIIEAAIQEIQNIIIQKYLALRETGDHLSSPFTLKMLLSIDKSNKIKTQVLLDIKTLVENIQKIDIQTIKNKIFKSKDLELIIQQFQDQYEVDFINFLKSNSEIISTYILEQQKLSYFFGRFGEYLNEEKTVFEKICLTNVLLGEAYYILGHFNHLQIIYNFYYHLRESKIFLNVVFFFEQYVSQEKTLNSLNTILYETKNALIHFIFLILNIDSNLSNFDQAYLSILSQYKIEQPKREQLEEEEIEEQMAEDEDFQKIFPKGVFNLSILRDLAGQSFEEMTENIQRLFFLTQVDFNEGIQITIKNVAKVQFLQQQSQTIMNLAQQYSLPQSKENSDFMTFISTFSNPQNKFEEQPINKLLAFVKECDFNFGQDYAGKQPIDKEIQKIEQLHEILEYSLKNLVNGSFLEMRDLIDDDDTESMSLIIKLDSLKPLLNVLQGLKRGYEQQKQLDPQFPVFSQLIKDLIQITRQYLNSAEIVSNVEECSRNFFKISQVSQSFEKKKSFITLAREIVKEGSYSFSLGSNNCQNIEIFVECPKKKYTEYEIRQICSRVILEQKTNTSIAASGEQKISDAKKLHGLAAVEQRNDYDFEGQEQRKEQALKQLDNDIDQFKEQWFQAEELKKVFFQLISFGNFHVLEQNRIYSNKNNSFNKTFQLMKDDNKKLLSELESWKEQIQQIFSIYPSFSLVGFRYYRQLSQYLAGEIETITYDLRQILNVLGNQDDEIEMIPQLFQTQQESQDTQEVTIKNIGSMICVNFEYPAIAGQQLQQMQSSRDQIIKLSFLGIREMIQYLVFKTSSLRRVPKYYQYFFYNSESDLSDIELFFYRFQCLTIPNEQLEFFLIFSTDIEQEFYCATQELLVNQLERFKLTTPNTLSILLLSSGKKHQNFSSIPEQSLDFLNESLDINSSAFFNECNSKAAFYFSEFPGEGKTLAIQRAGNSNDSQVRVPTSSSEKKSAFLQTFQQNVQSCESNIESIHIDLYESETYDLNILLFELIILRSVSIHSEKLLNIDSQVKIYIEIANTFQSNLLNSLYLFEIIQKIKVNFSLDYFLCNHPFQTEKQHNNVIICYQYLSALFLSGFSKDMNLKSISTFPIDNPDNIPSNKQLTSEEKNTFKQLLGKFVVSIIEAKGSRPCFYQLHRFIDLFGSEMMRFEKCIFLNVENVMRDLLKQGIRTKIVAMSYRLCIEISMGRCNSNQIQLNQNERKEVIMDRISKSIEPFSKCVVNFVTFQEQELSSITTFFDKESSVPESLKTLFKNYQKQMLFFDEENKPEDLLHWLILLINKNEQFMYKYQGSTVFANIAKKELRHLVRKITILKDNFFKIATLFMRIRSNTPLIIMGEAGIGKTVLVELMSKIMEANFQIMIVHTGISDQQVVDFVLNGIKLQEENNQRVVLFFDEVNTSKMIGGLFKEILIDRCMKGIQLPESIIPIAAINPYKLKSETQKNMLNIQIHGGIKKQLIQKITSSDLEYMVEPLPESMYNLIWNFNSLSNEDEKQYIQKMVEIKHQLECKKLKNNQEDKIYDSETLKRISDTLYKCQDHIRKEMGYESACSLRDVARFLNILYWMQNFLKTCILNHGLRDLDLTTACPCLTFYTIYCVRLPLNQQRQQFQEICALSMKKRKSDYDTIIENTQQFLIDECDVPSGIVKNSALKQNVFTLFVSIINKLPVVLIGPPGSSKTQSIKILIQTMKGRHSHSPFFKNFQALIPLFYQGHLQSTSERILEVFQKAIDKQDRIEKDKQSNEYLSLVYIEEIGLADISPHNPLKVLHSTLENPKVAVACLSNWPLDQSKMNRMISIFRLNTTEAELIETIFHIWNEFKENSDNSIQMALKTLLPYFLPGQIAKVYSVYLANLKIAQPKFEQFHGMRDFYGMVKLFCYQEAEFLKSKQKGEMSNEFKLTLRDRVCYAFQRHFSGLLQSQDILKSALSQYLSEDQSIPVFDDSLNLINTHLSEEQYPHYMPRHLMVITDNLSYSIEYLSSRLLNSQKSVKTLVGGEFSEDIILEKAYDIINEIISCVEQGTVLILSNLDSIYQSLYELLNQSYRNFNGKNYCKITFGADSNNIEVSPLFKLILVVHENDVQRLDGPLLNRFEKHFLSSSILLTQDDQHQVQTVQEYFQDPKLKNIFRFNNLMEMINTLVIQKRFLQEPTSNSELIQQLYHLAPIGKMLGESETNDALFKQKYIESNLHFDLDGLIKQKIDSTQKNKDTNIQLISIATPSSFVSSFTQYSPQVIYISSSSSSKNLEISLQDFFSGIQKDKELRQDPLILIIVFALDEPASKIRFVQQKVGETIAPLKNINRQVFVIIIVQVLENFKMIQFTGKWELYYLEDLKPLNFITDKSLLEMLSLKRWFSNLKQWIFEGIDFPYFLEYFLSNPENITTSYLRIKYKRISQGYQRNRIQQIQKTFDPSAQNDLQKHLQQFSSKIILLKLQLVLKELKIHSLEQFLEQYVIQQGFIKQSQSLPNAILKAIMNLLSHSLAFFISVLERNHLTYAYLHAPSKSNDYLSFLQMNTLEILRINGVENLETINQPGSHEWDFSDQFALETESKDFFLPICDKIFEDLTGFLKKPKQSICDIKLDITINTMMSLISYKDQQILQVFDEEASEDFIKYNCQGMSKLDVEVVNQLVPPSQSQAFISFLRFFACNSFFKKEIHMITNLLNMFYWMDDPYKLCQGYRPEEDQERNVKNYARFLLEKLFFMIQPSPDLMKLVKQKRINIITIVQFLIRFIQSIEIEREEGVLNIKQQLIIFQNLLLLFTKNNQIDSKLLGIVDLHKINSLDVLYIKDIKAALQAIDGKSVIEQHAQIQQLENDVMNQQGSSIEKKARKLFEQNWIIFILDLLLSVVQFKQQESFEQLCQEVVNYLSFIESDYLRLGFKIKDKTVIQMNVILSEVVKKCSSEILLLQFFQQQAQIIPQPGITSESATIVILSSCIQSILVSSSLRNQGNRSVLPQILVQAQSPEGLNPLQQAIYLAVFREVTQISLEAIEFPNRQPFDLSIRKYFASSLPTFLEVHVAKEFYHRYKQGPLMISQHKKSQYFKDSSWLQKYATPFTGLLSSEFLSADEHKSYQLLFSQKSSTKQALKQLFLEQLPKSDNIFGQIYKGNFNENMFYPFMMLNNIPLFHRDSRNNTQLYQCNNCKEYIFSNECPNLTSKAVCARCKKQIAKGTINTIQVLTNANGNPQALNNIIQTNQWMGYYIRIEEDQDAFKLDQGSSFDLRLFTIAYNLAFFYAYSKGKKYTQKKDITIFNQKTNTEESSSQEEITRLLRIHFQANPLEFLEEQIDYALQHISKISKTIFNMNKEENNIVIFKILSDLLLDQNIVGLSDSNSRPGLNQNISQMIKRTVEQSKQIILNKNSPLIDIVLEADQFDSATASREFKINLRTTSRSNSPNQLMDHLRLELKNNAYLILKEILDLPKLQYASQSLKVLVKFSQLMNKHLSKKFTQKKAQEITLLEALQGDVSHPLVQFFFKELIPAWEEIRDREKEFQIGCQPVQIQPIRNDSKLCNLVLSSDKQYGFFSNVLEILCNIQNSILDKILANAKLEKTENNNSDILYFIEHLFEREEKEQDQEIGVKPIEQIDTELNIIMPYNSDTLSQYIINDISYSKGRNLIWDLDGLQKELARQVISNTVKISLENSQMYPFLVEVTQINILNIDIPQSPLSELQKQQLEEALSSSEEGMELLLKLSTLFTIFRSEKNSANLTLEQALQSIQIKVPSGKIRMLFSSSFQLKHINGVIQVLENINMDQLIEGCNPIYRQEIEKPQLERTMKFLTQMNILENFSNALGRFIIRCLSQNQVAINEKSKLFEQLFDQMTYEEFWDDPSVLNQLYSLASKDETTIGQAYVLFNELQEEIMIYQEQQYLKEKARQEEQNNQDNNEMLMEQFTDKVQNLGKNKNKKKNRHRKR